MIAHISIPFKHTNSPLDITSSESYFLSKQNLNIALSIQSTTIGSTKLADVLTISPIP